MNLYEDIKNNLTESSDSSKDGKIRVTLYDDIKVFNSKEEALDYFKEAMSYCDPMSSEFRTYLRCYTQIKEGKTEIFDESEEDSIDLISYSIEQINKILEEIKETGVANQHLNNAIDLLFALKLKLEMKRKGFE